MKSRPPAPSRTTKETLPIIGKRLEAAFQAPGPMPNGWQAVKDGLWILDHVDKAHKVVRTDGSILKEIQTQATQGSGITYGDGTLLVAKRGAV